jgi:hypothetical protein
MRQTIHTLLWLALALGVRGADFATDFAGGKLDDGWQVKGDAKLDAGDGGRLRVGPGARVVRLFRDQDGSGEVSFRMLDDGGKAANPKGRVSGPRWGVITKDGHMLLVGAIYAPYLNGAATYSATDFKGSESPYGRIRYLGIKRDTKWHTWTFRFDPDKGGAILRDGKDVNGRTKRFDWNESKMPAFAGIVLLGDETPDKNNVILVDDVKATLGPPMRVQPTPPPPPPPVVPTTDPEATEVPALVENLRGVHPRLLFTPDELPALQERARTVSKDMFDAMVGYLGACNPPRDQKFLKDATDGQRQGLWRLPTVSLHYALTGDKASFAKARGYLELLLGLDHWETGGEQDSGMSSANIMIGFALGYDLLWNDLDPAFREKLRAKLLLMARRQYYRGHLAKAKGVHYWQNDPANNHRWHRNGGLALALCAIAGDGPGDEWLRGRMVEDLRFVHDWLSDDGSSHESPSYIIFGLPHLVLAFDACDRVFGTDLMSHPFFPETVKFRLHTLTPGMTRTFGFGDSGEQAFGGYHHALWRCLGANGDPEEYRLLRKLMAKRPDAFAFGWMGVAWHRPPATGEGRPFPKVGMFPDLGMVFLRDGWGEDAVAMSFKCGPYGGEVLNRFRHAEAIEHAPLLANSRPGRYINVAHDDPDANSLMLYARGQMILKDDGYAKHKQTASHNTILVDGKGQLGSKGAVWSQPLKGVDMSSLVEMFDLVPLAGGGVVAQGEAGRMYAYARGKSLDLFRRTVIWLPADYVLVVDHVRAPDAVEVTWLAQSRDATSKGGEFALADGDATLVGALGSTADLGTTVVDSPADHRGKPMGYRQLRASANGQEIVTAMLLDPWQRGRLGVRVGAEGIVTVHGPFGTDQWRIAVPTADESAKVTGERDGKSLVP